jgi:hypothetical protein
VVVSVYLAIDFFTTFCSSFITIVLYTFRDCYISQYVLLFHNISSHNTVGSYGHFFKIIWEHFQYKKFSKFLGTFSKFSKILGIFSKVLGIFEKYFGHILKILKFF